MSRNIDVAQLTYLNRALGSTDSVIVGVFSARSLAEEAIENLVEGTLDVSFDAEVLSQSIGEYFLDRSIEQQQEAEVAANLGIELVPLSINCISLCPLNKL